MARLRARRPRGRVRLTAGFARRHPNHHLVSERDPGGSYQTVADLVTAGQRQTLLQEALGLRHRAEISERRDFQLVEGTQLLSPARKRFIQAGAIRRALHAGAVAERTSAVLGRQVKAALSSYLLYEPGDFLGLHVDQRVCQVTVLVLLAGDPGPLYVHPGLQGLPAHELLRLSQAHAGHPPGGTAVHLQDGPLLLRGAELPHHRPAHDGDANVALAAFCYSLLSPDDH